MKKGCLITIVVFIATVFVLFWSARNYLTSYEFGINEENPQLDWIPPEARNVTFYSDWVSKSAEFSIDEESMVAWAESIERPLERIKEEGEEDYEVHTSRSMLERIGAIEPLPEPVTTEEIEKWFSSRRKEFEVGDLYYRVWWRNGGGHWIGYDVSEGRGYYYYAHH